MAKKTDYTKQTDLDLVKDLKDKKKALKDFQLSIWGSKTRDTKEGKNIRKEIARIQTEMNKRTNAITK